MNLKFLLMCFESMSGLKVNFDKSKVVVMGCDEENQMRAAYMMNCKLGSFPITYVGHPFAPWKLTTADFRSLTKKVANRVEPWKGK